MRKSTLTEMIPWILHSANIVACIIEMEHTSPLDWNLPFSHLLFNNKMLCVVCSHRTHWKAECIAQNYRAVPTVYIHNMYSTAMKSLRFPSKSSVENIIQRNGKNAQFSLALSPIFLFHSINIDFYKLSQILFVIRLSVTLSPLVRA